MDWRTQEKLYTQKEMDDQRDFFKLQTIIILEELELESAFGFENVFLACKELDIEPENIQIKDDSGNNILNFISDIKSGSAVLYLEDHYHKAIEEHYRNDFDGSDYDDEPYSHMFG